MKSDIYWLWMAVIFVCSTLFGMYSAKYTIDIDQRFIYQEARRAKSDCEKSLSRDQNCVIVITSEPSKE